MSINRHILLPLSTPMRNKYIPLHRTTKYLVQSFIALTVSFLRFAKCVFFFSTNSLFKEFIQSKNILFIQYHGFQLSCSYAMKPLQGNALQQYRSSSLIHDNRKNKVICYPIFEKFINAGL